MYYTGIGSRETPDDILDLMESAARALRHRAGYTLRSGGADGADSAFERGAGSQSEIYLPWKGFNGSNSPLYHISTEAMELAASLHPAWSRCSQGARKLHARNCYQVLGSDLNAPSRFVLCWHNGSGGTLQACRLAEACGVPIRNLADTHTRTAVFEFCNS